MTNKRNKSHDHLDSFCGRTRRQFLWETGGGFTGLALASLLDRDGFFTSRAKAASVNPMAPKVAHFAPKAKSCIFLFMEGGPSAIDTFDYKPAVQKRAGEKTDGKTIMATARTLKQYGQSGHWCSDALPHMSQHVDKLAMVKALHADAFNHGQAMLQMNTGRAVQGSPSLGSWVGYGLGSINENLPAYVVMLGESKRIISGTLNWGTGFMPAAYQGTVLRSEGEAILNLNSPKDTPRPLRRKQVDAINALNAQHLDKHPGYSELQARIASYELAFQLQTAAPEALDLAKEDDRTKEMYGLNDPKPEHIKGSHGPAHYGRQCLTARRLVERGVRFVQLYSSGWDAHSDCDGNHLARCSETDKPIAALLTDLQQRGLLEETLVVWGGEFGRLPFSQGGDDRGRNHNPNGFLFWMAGGGIEPGVSYGETDELGHRAVSGDRHIRDLHATILHMMGLDHYKLNYFYGGIDQRITGPNSASPIREIMI